MRSWLSQRTSSLRHDAFARGFLGRARERRDAPLTPPVATDCPCRPTDHRGPRCPDHVNDPRSSGPKRLPSKSVLSFRALARPLRTPPATSARLCRRASASIARLRPVTSFLGRPSGAPRPPLSKGRELVPPYSACAAWEGEWSALVDVCRPSAPRARSVESREPRRKGPRGSLRSCGPSDHGAPWSVGLQPSLRGPAPLSRRQLNRRLRGALALARQQFVRYPVTPTASTPSSQYSCGGVWRNPPNRKRCLRRWRWD